MDAPGYGSARGREVRLTMIPEPIGSLAFGVLRRIRSRSIQPTIRFFHVGGSVGQRRRHGLSSSIPCRLALFL